MLSFASIQTLFTGRISCPAGTLRCSRVSQDAYLVRILSSIEIGCSRHHMLGSKPELFVQNCSFLGDRKKFAFSRTSHRIRCHRVNRRSVLCALLTPTFLVVAGGVVSFALSAALGANDVANSLGTAVGTGAISVTFALVIGAAMEFAGALLFGSTVTKTISSGVVTISSSTFITPASYMLGMLAVLVGCTFWMITATKFGLPVSSTHSVVGALVGLGLVSGWGVNGRAITRIVSSWFLSPLTGGIVSLVLYRVISLGILQAKEPNVAAQRYLPFIVGSASFLTSMPVLRKGVRVVKLSSGRLICLSLVVSLAFSAVSALFSSDIFPIHHTPRKPFSSTSYESLEISEQRVTVEQIFKIPQALTASLLAFSHGSNDVSNAIGPFAAMYCTWLNGGSGNSTVEFPAWILAMGGVGISSGLALFGKPVMDTVGTKITKLHPTMGFCVELSTALTVLVASQLGLPVSTTHTLIGCIVALGIFRKDITGVNGKVILSIAASWCVTVPFSAIATILFFALLRPLLPVVPAML